MIICEKLQPFAPALALLASSFQFFTPFATVFAEECGDFGFIFGPVKRSVTIDIFCVYFCFLGDQCGNDFVVSPVGGAVQRRPSIFIPDTQLRAPGAE